MSQSLRRRNPFLPSAVFLVAFLAVMAAVGARVWAQEAGAAADRTFDSTPAEPAEIPGATVLKHDDGAMDGKKDLQDKGYFVKFQCPPGEWYLVGVQIFGSRFGTVAPPKDDFFITICDSAYRQLMPTKKPYSTFERGLERWYMIDTYPFMLPAYSEGDPPREFWINVAFYANRDKGVYVGYDTSDKISYSKTGLPNERALSIADRYNWMIRAVIAPREVAFAAVTKQAGGAATAAPPARPARPGAPTAPPARPSGMSSTKPTDLVELKYDDDKPNGKQNHLQGGPAKSFEKAPLGSKVVGISIYGERYGTADASKVFGELYIMDNDLKVLGTGKFRHSDFEYNPKWVDVHTEGEIEVPETFWVFINSHSDGIRGINFYYDTDVETLHSKDGRAPDDLRPMGEKREWMIRAYVKKPGKK